ncbi:hypothetical protein M0813_04248 [Anaeramoeba flamelloides]|uniref:Uncharacterized protein n=1 Tax=Anaeramoeba flamelloides TaxID=1746091 RepID=A0ABQ8XKG2_9EUKA|nr:hypothetical protein M0813_04248 [Anaeramoeba flamelloides]
MENIDQEILNFGDLFWGFGYYLYCSLNDNEIFREKKMRKHFLRTLFPNSKSKRRQHKKHLELVQVLLNQNSVVLRPESKTVGKSVLNKSNDTSQLKRKSRHYVPHPNQYYLNPHWRTLFMDPKYSFSPIFEKRINQNTVHLLPPKKRSKKFSPQRVSHPDRTIGILGFKIHKILQNEPKTREQIEKETQFPRQRVSLVLSVYKGLKMIIEDQSTGYFYWNYEQSVTFPKTTRYFSELIKAKKTKQLLFNRLSELSKRLMEKAVQKKNISVETQRKLRNAFETLPNQQTQNTGTNDNNNSNERLKENKDGNNTRIPSKIEIQELLTSLAQKRKHLQKLRNHVQSILNQKKLNGKQFFGNNLTIAKKEVETITDNQPTRQSKKQEKIIQKQKTKQIFNTKPKQQELPFKSRRSKRRLHQMERSNFFLTNTNTNTKTNKNTNINTEQPKLLNEGQLQVQTLTMETLPSSPLSLFHENNRQDLIETDISSDDVYNDDDDNDENQQNKNYMQITDTRESHDKTTLTNEEMLLRGRTKKETEAVQAILQLRPFNFNEQANNKSFYSQQQQKKNNNNFDQKFSTSMPLLQNKFFNTLLSYSNSFLNTEKNQKI